MTSSKDTIRFRAMSDSELDTHLLDFRKEQLNLRFQRKNSQLTNTSRIRAVRRLVAKLKTEQSARVRAKTAEAK